MSLFESGHSNGAISAVPTSVASMGGAVTLAERCGYCVRSRAPWPPPRP
jgi:hypothetical protein